MPEFRHQRPHIVILGGGFGGLAAALALDTLRRSGARYNVTLIDKNCYHLYHALLYEVATASVDIGPDRLEALERGVCIRIKALHSIFLKRNINVMQGLVTGLDTSGHCIHLDGQPDVHYDHLIVALGSEPQYFDIPGLAERSVSLKELPDALRIHVRLATFLSASIGRPWRIVVGGAGVSGVEVSAEIAHYLHRLEGDGRLPPAAVTIDLLEAAPMILPGLDEWVQQAARQRLDRLDVRCHPGQTIVEVSPAEVVTKDGQRFRYDLLVWAGGIQAHRLVRQAGWPTNRKGQAMVEPTLRVPGVKNVSVIGDSVALLDPATNRPVPQIAPEAVAQGRHAAENIVRSLRGQPLRPYRPVHRGYVIPVGGRWAVSTIGGRATGFVGWLARKRLDLEYFLSILPLGAAWKVFWKGGRIYLEND